MKVIIGQGSCGIATGAKKTQAEFEAQIAAKGVNVEIDFTGCVGTCYLEPIVDVYEDNGDMTRYVKVQPDKVERIVEEHLKGGKVVEEFAIAPEDQQFLDKQQRVVLIHCGLINPEKIEEYLAVGGYEALIDPDCKDKDLLALIQYISAEDKIEKILENQKVIKVPIVRNGKQATLGYKPEVWKEWK